MTHTLEFFFDQGYWCYECHHQIPVAATVVVRVDPKPDGIERWLCSNCLINHINDGSLVLTSGQATPVETPPEPVDDAVVEASW